jgi:steroid delta-isomerase-like uncharacterized protein
MEHRSSLYNVRQSAYPAVMTSEPAVDTVRAHRERIVREHMADENRLDFERVLSTFPHPHYEIVATGEVHDGHAAVNAYYESSRRAFPDQRNELISLRHADDAVIVEFWLRGTHLGPFDDAPPTGNAFECRVMAFFVFEGERLVVERVYFDVLTILKQLLGNVSIRKPSTIAGAARLLRALQKRTRKARD